VSKNKIFFLIIFVFSLIFRFWKLGEYPLSLNWDEISHGYNAYSLLNTGKDQWGVSWPIFNFKAYGDYPTALNLYLTIPFIFIFGLNQFSIRLPAAILGLFFTLLIYLMARYLTKNRYLSLIAFGIASFSPWTFFPARGVFQSNLAQLFLVLGIYLFFVSKDRFKFLLASSISFGLSMYSYHNTRIVAPLIVMLLLILYKKFKKIYILFLAIFLIFAVPNIFNLFSPSSVSRNRWVGIINPITVNLINENRRVFEGPQFINILVNNKVTFFAKEFSLNFLNFLNPVPLFFTGSQNYQFNPPQTGLIFPIFIPFFYIGLFFCLKNIFKDKNYLFLILGFIICLIPAALTMGDFPSIRLTIATPFYYLFITFGFLPFIKKTRGYLLPMFLVLTLTFFFNYFNNYKIYCQNFADTWQYGYQSLVSEIKTQYANYSKIYITKKYGEPHEFILFYWPWDPKKYQTDFNLKTDFHSDWYWVDSFDKFVFLNDWEIKNIIFPKDSLLVTSPQNFPSANSKYLKSIYYPNQNPVFDIVSYE
jgi:4-amino-4-deoxy-L-arabinose transferase-like glycosyltransferase